MTKVYYEEDADLAVLKDKVVAVIGYGIQGRAQALNLRDSGIRTILGLRRGGKSWELAKAEGFDVKEVGCSVSDADVCLILIPDMAQPELYRSEILPNLRDGNAVGFAHGFNVHFGYIRPPPYVDVFMVAPKAPGQKVREEYLQGRGVPSLVAVYQDHSKNALDIALAVAKAIGSTRAGVIETTFREETETDLIGEQTVLVGGLIELIRNGFEVLVELGYQPEVAYFEALNEAKLIMDLIWQHGMVGMLERVSETARFGGMTVGPKVVDERVKSNMKEAARRVISSEFAREWVDEYNKGSPRLKELLEQLRSHKVEEVGKRLREMMSM
ncbi:MAG: ketol-acid reductoisomerase [Candidatus Bathyarchaeia archaeon]